MNWSTVLFLALLAILIAILVKCSDSKPEHEYPYPTWDKEHRLGHEYLIRTHKGQVSVVHDPDCLCRKKYVVGYDY